MKIACIAIGAAWLALCPVACSSGDSAAPAVCDGGDAGRLGDARTADALGDVRPADGASDGTSADAVSDVTSGDVRDSQTVASDGGTDGHVDGGPIGDARADADSGRVNIGVDATPSTTTLLRFANWSPDAPAVDFCLAPHGTSTFRGPIVASMGASDNAGLSGLSLGLSRDGGSAQSVGAYFDVPPGQYDVRLVAAGAGSCAVAILPDVTTLQRTLTVGTFSTIALIGAALPSGGDPGLRVVIFPDDGVSTGLIQLRFIHVAPGLAQMDIGISTIGATPDSKPQLQMLFVGVPFGEASAAKYDPKAPAASLPMVDDNGYQRILKMADARFSARPSGGAVDSVATQPLSVAWGSVLTIALVGGTSSGVPPRLLECIDNAGTVGPFSNCSLLP